MTPSEERSYQEVLGSWMANAADDIRDMGRRVQEVLTRDPRDHHYAATKTTHALHKAVEIMVYANSSEDELLELVRDAQQTALRRAAELRRECEDAHAPGRSTAHAAAHHTKHGRP